LTHHVRPARGRFYVLVAAMLALALLVPAGVLAKKPPPPAPVTIQILNPSDWHGNVDPVGGIGGAWNLSARWQEDRLAYPSLTVMAGDDFGASPPLSSFFDEVPGVLAERMMGVQVGALGNHNFDGGIAHLQQMIDLAGSPTSAQNPGQPYRYVAANLRNLSDNLSGVDPVRYFNVGGLKVAVIGITNEEAPNLVLPGAFGTIQVTDGVTAANKFARIARKNGSNVVLVITHKGIRSLDPVPAGELIDFAEGLQTGLVDVVFGDHTDIQYFGTHNGVLVHENRSFGVTYAKTLITAQPGKGGGVLSKSVSFVTPTATPLTGGNTQCPAAPAYCDQAIVDMLVPYRQQLSALFDGKIGTTTQPYKRGGNIERRQETDLGNLITDGMRWRYGTQLAFMNGGGIRQQLPTCSYLPVDTTMNRANWNSTFTTITACPGYGGTAPYDIVLGDVNAVLLFANILNTRTVTGEQIWLAMEQGVRAIDAAGNGLDGRFPQISGFKFSFRYDIPSGCTGSTCVVSRVQSVALTDGTPIPNSSSATYTMTLPNFVNLGGDGYYMFNDGTGASQEIDWIVLSKYIEAFPTLDPTADPLGRITKCNGPCT
jgi:5'-nucleotidase